MKPLLIPILALGLGTTQLAQAQDVAPEAPADDRNTELQQGAELLSEGFGLIMRGLAQELQPLEESWAELIALLGDMTAYYPPEVLPNGDILIRKRPPAVPTAPEPDAETGETEL